MLMKLKLVYALVEQLYTGTQRTLVAISNRKQPPTLIKTVMDQLSIVSGQIKELKLSGGHAGAISTLGRAKAWQSKLDPEEIATGCPEFKDDGSAFEEQVFNNCIKEM